MEQCNSAIISVKNTFIERLCHKRDEHLEKEKNRKNAEKKSKLQLKKLQKESYPQRLVAACLRKHFGDDFDPAEVAHIPEKEFRALLQKAKKTRRLQRCVYAVFYGSLLQLVPVIIAGSTLFNENIIIISTAILTFFAGPLIAVGCAELLKVSSEHFDPDQFQFDGKALTTKTLPQKSPEQQTAAQK